MSNLSNEMSFPKEPVNDASSTSSLVMLFTILLLIAGLLMTGTMMLYYVNTHHNDLTKTTRKTKESTQILNPISFFFEKIKSETHIANLYNTKTDTNSGVIDQLFGDRNNLSANWPKLKLTGFGSATAGNGGFAIINNHQYRQGDLINGKVTLIKIRKHDILMEYEGETNTLSMKTSD